MRKERKPDEDRKPEDHRQAAEDSLELAKVLAGQGGISDQDFLERMARSDALVDHDGETCGMCHNMILGAQVAREMIEAGEYEGVVGKWAAETRRRWEGANSSSCGSKSGRPAVTRTRRSRSGGGSLEGRGLLGTHGSDQVTTHAGEHLKNGGVLRTGTGAAADLGHFRGGQTAVAG